MIGKTNSQLSGGSALPSGYTKLNYIESTGTQCINSDTCSNRRVKFSIDCQLTGDLSTGFHTIIGGWNEGSPKYAVIASPNDNTGYLIQWDNQYQYCGTKDNNRHTFTFDASNKKFCIDETEYTINNVFSDTDGALWISACNNNGSAYSGWNASMKLYGCDMWEALPSGNFAHIHHFIPCLDTNNRPCMYDTVSKQPFYNAGTGEFLYG